MNDHDYAAMMISIAERDLRAAKGMKNEEIFADEIFGFHVQQVIEKSLKAWIAGIGEEFPLTHNIGKLLNVLEEKGQNTGEFDEFIEYTAFSVEHRYDLGEGLGEAIDRDAAIKKAERLYERVKELILGKDSL